MTVSCSLPSSQEKDLAAPKNWPKCPIDHIPESSHHLPWVPVRINHTAESNSMNHAFARMSAEHMASLNTLKKRQIFELKWILSLLPLETSEYSGSLLQCYSYRVRYFVIHMDSSHKRLQCNITRRKVEVSNPAKCRETVIGNHLCRVYRKPVCPCCLSYHMGLMQVTKSGYSNQLVASCLLIDKARKANFPWTSVISLNPEGFPMSRKGWVYTTLPSKQ